MWNFGGEFREAPNSTAELYAARLGVEGEMWKYRDNLTYLIEALFPGYYAINWHFLVTCS